MGLRFCDSYDHYDTAHITSKWTSIAPSAVAINTTSQRNGVGCMQISGVGAFKTIDNIQTWFVGAAMQWQAYGGGMAFYNDNNIEFQWQLQADGTIHAFTGAGGTFVTSPTLAISLAKYYYIECGVQLSTSGFITIKINGQTVLNTSGVHTCISSDNNADMLNMFGPGGANVVWVDDLYVCDTSGVANTTFMGDVKIGVITATDEGDVNQWNPVGSATNWENIAEIPPDDDTTYNYSSNTTTVINAGPLDLYKYQPVSATRNVLGIQSNIFARKDDEGYRAVSIVTSNGGSTNVTDTAGRFLNFNYIDYLDQFDVNPITGVGWTPTVVNTTQWGIKVIV